VVFGVGVGRVGGYDVANPTERSARAYPEAGCEDEPENARQDSPVVELAHAGNNKAQNSCQKRITHYFFSTSALLYTRKPAALFKQTIKSKSRRAAMQNDELKKAFKIESSLHSSLRHSDF
jgi:hypothetical protein